VRDKDLSIRGKDQRLRQNRLVPNGDQFLVTTLDVQVAFSQKEQDDDVGCRMMTNGLTIWCTGRIRYLDNRKDT
jgi:hypothetical protein